MVGALGELLGAVAVVASLIYVGRQINQNTTVAKAEAYRDISLRYSQVAVEWVDPAFLPVYRRIFDGASGDDLSPEERLQAAGYIESVLRLYETVFRQVESGVLDEGAFQNLGELMFTLPIFTEVWAVLRGEFDTAFVEFLEDRYDLRVHQNSLSP
jgi:hypothetical protein